MRHFFRLYIFLVISMLLASWCVELLWNGFARESRGPVDYRVQDTIKAIELRLLDLPTQRWPAEVQRYSEYLTNEVMLIPLEDIAGSLSLDKLKHGEILSTQSSDRQWWTLKQIDRHDSVLVISSVGANSSRTWFEWLLSLLLYGAIALAVMLWVWPLSRDIAKLQRATATFGNRSWAFNVRISPRSQVYQLSESFRSMAHRIDRLIQSHKDISNAVSHEINTPLARMRFEIENAEASHDPKQIKDSLRHMKSDINQINDLVSATLKYAILDRADFSLNLKSHNFFELLPALVRQVKAEVSRDIEIEYILQDPAPDVVCDAYLMETALRNLLLNAGRYAHSKVFLQYQRAGDFHHIYVKDDGPGISEKDREKIFDSFTQLKQPTEKKGKFGLGLAIVKRIMEWHQGEVRVLESEIGGASFLLSWPINLKG